MLRDPVAKFWSYFWELKSYGGEFEKMSFAAFLAPKLARTKECLKLDPASNLWPPSLPPPHAGCAPHLDHGLYHPQLQRWLQFFEPRQFLVVSFAGYALQPDIVVRDVLRHAGAPTAVADAAAQRTHAHGATKLQNSRAGRRGSMPREAWEALHALYDPFVERLYSLLDSQGIAVSPCEERGTRFLDGPPWRNVTSGRGGGGGGNKRAGRGGARGLSLRSGRRGRVGLPRVSLDS